MKYVLPDCDYNNLRRWHENFQYKEKYIDYYKKIHENLGNKNYIIKLTENEKDILNKLLSSENISEKNLWDYFLNFEKIKKQSDLEKKVITNLKKKLNYSLSLYDFNEAKKLLIKNHKLLSKIDYDNIEKHYKKNILKKKY